MKAEIISVNLSAKKGEKKRPVASGNLIKGLGIEGDAHIGSERQLSLLASESIQKLGGNFEFGDFAENLTTNGIDLMSLPIGAVLRLGGNAVIKIVKKGKECHAPCEIFRKHGQCVMPTEGVFAEVVSGGIVSGGAEIVVLSLI